MLLRVLLRTLALRSRLRLRRPPRRPGGEPVRAIFLSAFPPGHYGTIARFTRWVPHLERRGIEARVLCPCTDEEFAAFGRGDVEADARYHRAVLANRREQLFSAARADVVVLHRGVMPFGPYQRPGLEAAFTRLNPRWIHDFYDSIWVRRRSAAEGSRTRLARWLNPPDLTESIAGLASAVTVTSEYLAQFLDGVNDDVRILPMLLEPDDYPVRRHGPVDPVVFGWMGGAYNVARLEAVGPALTRAAAEAKILLRTVSPTDVRIPGVRVEALTHPWSAESEVRDLLSFDAGLLPLFDGPIDLGKFPLKLLQYAAAGLPIVASPHAVEALGFRDGESILLADDEESWTRAVLDLARDPALRARLGAGARRVLEERYSFAAHADAFAGLLRQVARDPRSGA